MPGLQRLCAARRLHKSGCGGLRHWRAARTAWTCALFRSASLHSIYPLGPCPRPWPFGWPSTVFLPPRRRHAPPSPAAAPGPGHAAPPILQHASSQRGAMGGLSISPRGGSCGGAPRFDPSPFRVSDFRVLVYVFLGFKVDLQPMLSHCRSCCRTSGWPWRATPSRAPCSRPSCGSPRRLLRPPGKWRPRRQPLTPTWFVCLARGKATSLQRPHVQFRRGQAAEACLAAGCLEVIDPSYHAMYLFTTHKNPSARPVRAVLL